MELSNLKEIPGGYLFSWNIAHFLREKYKMNANYCVIFVICVFLLFQQKQEQEQELKNGKRWQKTNTCSLK